MSFWPVAELNEYNFIGWENREIEYDPHNDDEGALSTNPYDGSWYVDFENKNKCWIVLNGRKYKSIETNVSTGEIICTTKNNIKDIYTCEIKLNTSRISNNYTDPESETESTNTENSAVTSEDTSEDTPEDTSEDITEEII